MAAEITYSGLRVDAAGCHDHPGGPGFWEETLMNRNLARTSCAAVVLTTGLVACQSSGPAPVYDGANLYAGYCASCHGPTGAGDGPMTPHLTAGLPDLRTLAARNDGRFPREQLTALIDGRSFRSVHGATDMPVWGFQFRREEGMTEEGIRNVNARIDALVNHIESLQQ
jgi:mono/diheme cytochrome c family protein